MLEQVMVDLETLGTGPDAIILSIGAVKFRAATNEILGRFHVAIDPQSCIPYKFTVTGDTIMWWFAEERDAARKSLLAQQRLDIATALEGFALWYGGQSLQTWGNGAAFDNVILRSAFDKVGIECPWKFWDDRCYRTLKGLFPHIMQVREGVHHNALDDAIHQTEHLLKILAHTRGDVL